MSVFTVNVYTGREREIARAVKRLNHPEVYDVYVPCSPFGTPSFPGYIFIDMAPKPEPYYAIMQIPDVFFFLNNKFQAYPLSIKEEERIKGRVPVPLIGRLVRVVEGQYEGMIGRIREFNYPRALIEPLNFNRLEKIPALKIHVRYLMLFDESNIWVGARVRFKNGDYAGLTGTVTDLSNTQAVIRVQIFNQEALIGAEKQELEVIA